MTRIEVVCIRDQSMGEQSSAAFVPSACPTTPLNDASGVSHGRDLQNYAVPAMARPNASQQCTQSL